MKKWNVYVGFWSILFSVGWKSRDWWRTRDSSYVTFSEVTSAWGVSAVAILDCSLKVYAGGRQKARAMPAYCVAANCSDSQATQSITMHEFPRNRPAVRRLNGSNLYNSNELTLMLRLSHAHLCSEHFAESDFVNFTAEYQIGFASKRNL